MLAAKLEEMDKEDVDEGYGMKKYEEDDVDAKNEAKEEDDKDEECNSDDEKLFMKENYELNSSTLNKIKNCYS